MFSYLAQAFLFIGIFVAGLNIFLWYFSRKELKKTIKRRLKIEGADAVVSPPLWRFLDPLTPLNKIVAKRFLKNRELLESKLFGARAGLSVEQFFAVKEFVTLVVFIGAMVVLSGDFIVYIPIAVIVGFFLPDFWLKTKLTQRKAAVVRALPDTVDLLALCVNAGLDFVAATRWIIEKATPTAFTEELAFMMNEIRMGKPRREALRSLARRIDAPDVMAFSRTLVQADRMGTPIAEALAILSEDVRERFFRRAERTALQAPMKMLIPLIFFILPVVGVIVGGPIAIQFMQGDLLSGGMAAGGGPKM